MSSKEQRSVHNFFLKGLSTPRGQCLAGFDNIYSCSASWVRVDVRVGLPSVNEMGGLCWIRAESEITEVELTKVYLGSYRSLAADKALARRDLETLSPETSEIIWTRLFFLLVESCLVYSSSGRWMQKLANSYFRLIHNLQLVSISL